MKKISACIFTVFLLATCILISSANAALPGSIDRRQFDSYVETDSGEVAVRIKVEDDWELGTTLTESSGVAYYKGVEIGTGSGTSPFTDSGTIISNTNASRDLSFGGTLYVDESTERVGIGTTSPAKTLQIDGGPNTGVLVRNTGGSKAFFMGCGGGAPYFEAYQKMYFQVTGTYASVGNGGGPAGIIIDTTANVGIRETAPDAPLQVKGTGTGTSKLVNFTDGSDNDKFTVLENGNVGIGVNNPSNKFQIYDGTYTLKADGNEFEHPDNNPFYFKSGGDIYLQADTDDTTDNFVFKANGNFGIADTSPSSKLDVAGDANIDNDLTTNGGTIFLTRGEADADQGVLGIASEDNTIWYITVDNSGVISTSSTKP